MARFEVPEGWTVQAYRFALAPTAAQAAALESHAGAARFAYNTMLAAVKANLGQREAERSYGIGDAGLTPCLGWSMMTLRREWNRRKATAAPWWAQNSKEAYASGCQALACGLENWAKSREGARKGPRTGFPRFKSKHRAAKAVTFTTGDDQGLRRPQACHPAPAGDGQDARVDPQAGPPRRAPHRAHHPRHGAV